MFREVFADASRFGWEGNAGRAAIWFRRARSSLEIGLEVAGGVARPNGLDHQRQRESLDALRERGDIDRALTDRGRAWVSAEAFDFEQFGSAPDTAEQVVLPFLKDLIQLARAVSNRLGEGRPLHDAERWLLAEQEYRAPVQVDSAGAARRTEPEAIRMEEHTVSGDKTSG